METGLYPCLGWLEALHLNDEVVVNKIYVIRDKDAHPGIFKIKAYEK